MYVWWQSHMNQKTEFYTLVTVARSDGALGKDVHSPVHSVCCKAKFYDHYCRKSASYVTNGWIKLCHYLFLRRISYLQNFIRLCHCLAVLLDLLMQGYLLLTELEYFTLFLTKTKSFKLAQKLQVILLAFTCILAVYKKYSIILAKVLYLLWKIPTRDRFKVIFIFLV